jgi:hypothetical protein
MRGVPRWVNQRTEAPGGERRHHPRLDEREHLPRGPLARTARRCSRSMSYAREQPDRSYQTQVLSTQEPEAHWLPVPAAAGARARPAGPARRTRVVREAGRPALCSSAVATGVAGPARSGGGAEVVASALRVARTRGTQLSTVRTTPARAVRADRAVNVLCAFRAAVAGRRVARGTPRGSRRGPSRDTLGSSRQDISLSHLEHGHNFVCPCANPRAPNRAIPTSQRQSSMKRAMVDVGQPR